LELEESDVREILGRVLYQFPVRELAVELPRWVMTLERGHWLRAAIYGHMREAAAAMNKMSDLPNCLALLKECQYICRVGQPAIDLGQGSARVQVDLQPDLFYQVLGEATGLDVGGEEGLFPCLIELARIKKEYERVRGALEEVEATGYGIVMPTMDQLRLEEPEIMRQGGRYGVRLKASAPSIHMMRADILTEVAPVVGNEKQSEELVRYLLGEFEENPRKIWESNIFGKSLHELVNEGLRNKLYRMPADARLKMQETIERIINEGCSGLICIIL
ncbi:MAG: stage IV sporulation protein A, partial [Oscillospiraceae bacterium]|nr:stage IV sporulation protein A [Oscillospiraceae bacterium]